MMETFFKIVCCLMFLGASAQNISSNEFEGQGTNSSLDFEDAFLYEHEEDDVLLGKTVSMAELAKYNELPLRTLVAPKNIPEGFYAITEVLDSKKVAKKHIRSLRKQKITSDFFENENTGLHYVYVSYDKDGEKAISAANFIKAKGYPSTSVWVLKVVHEEYKSVLVRSGVTDALVIDTDERTDNVRTLAKTATKESRSIDESPNLTKLVQKADYYFNKMWYAEAAKYYELALAKGESQYSYDVIEKTADSHYFNTNMEQALKWYDLLFEHYGNELSNENLFKYGHVLKGNSNYKRAKRILNIYNKKVSDEQSDHLKNRGYHSKVLDKIMQIQKNVKLTNLEINSSYSEFSPMFYNEGEMVFASAIESDANDKKYKWNDQPFLDLYTAKLNEKSDELKDALKFSSKINSKYHEASVAFSPDNETMYFTRNNYGKKLRKDQNGINHLKIYISKKVGGEWSEPKGMPFNSDDFSTGHPALSPEGKQLYFVSDMPGSIGETDIFVVDVLENGGFSEPRNLGPKINTDKREMFPFITDSKLYFSSDGHIGLGGLDIFEAIIDEDKGFDDPMNLGRPLNSQVDDFSFIIDEKKQIGYLASNRPGGKGSDDIYLFKKLLPEENIENTIAGVVTDLVTGENMPGAMVMLLDKDDRKLEEFEVKEDGSFIFEDLDSNKIYKVKTTIPDYFDKERIVETKHNERVNTTIKMKRLKDIIVIEGGIKKLKTEKILFDFDRHSIRQDASVELDKIFEVMSEHKNMVIKIESHTDSRGSRIYNRSLSDRRAKSTRDYLISRGIAPARIVSAIGYGEERLLNNCDGSVSCSRESHQLNRRSEFVIVNM